MKIRSTLMSLVLAVPAFVLPTSTLASNCSPPFSAPNAYPDACYQPFTHLGNSPVSPFNIPVFSYNPVPTQHPNSTTWNNFYLSTYGGYFPNIQTGYANNVNDYTHPIYYGRSGDPRYIVHCTATWATCNTGSIQFPIPSYAQPAGGTDHHIVAIDETVNPPNELDCWNTQPLSGTGGTLNAASCGFGNTNLGNVGGTGLGWGQTQSGVALQAGVIRDQELIQGQINHALLLIAPCTNADNPVFPSNWTITQSQCVNNQGAPYGSWFRLNMSVPAINSLNIPTFHKTILIALAVYGSFIVDTSNGYPFAFQFESDLGYSRAGYTNPECPTNGAPCTPLTAYLHSIGDPGWTGDRYNIDLSHDVNWNWYGQWLNPPTQQ